MRLMSYSECVDYIRNDYYRITGRRDASILRMWMAGILDVGFRFLFWWRLSKCNNKLVGGAGRAVSRWINVRHKISIERDTEIGYGFRIVHGGPVVVNASAVIGDNVDLYQFTTIGSMTLQAAHIGNNVYIGPSVCIVENVTIGDGVTIGAGAVVVKDVEPGVTVAGNPAHVISRKEPGRLIYRKWDRAMNQNN